MEKEMIQLDNIHITRNRANQILTARSSDNQSRDVCLFCYILKLLTDFCHPIYWLFPPVLLPSPLHLKSLRTAASPFTCPFASLSLFPLYINLSPPKISADVSVHIYFTLDPFPMSQPYTGGGRKSISLELCRSLTIMDRFKFQHNK